MSFNNKKEYRICIVSDQLATGGAERCSAILSQFFENNNCKVHHVILVDKIEYEFSGALLNLGKIRTKGFLNKIKTLKVFYGFFRTNTFDFIIDTRVMYSQWQEFFVSKFIYKNPTIKMVHSFMTHLYFPKNRYLSKNIYSDCYKIIAVSNEIKSKIEADFEYKNVAIIYNSIDLDSINQLSNEIVDESNFILAAGSMNTNVKQFDVLINCYAKSNLPKDGINLIILGDGKLKNELILLIDKLNLERKVIFKNHVSNPFSYYKNAIFTVLTSKNEGFPTVLLESLACKTPIVSFDCPSGPSEIIMNYENGILVENQNQEKMIDAMNQMILDKKLYLHCKKNAQLSVDNFSIDKIGNQWLQLFKNN